MNIYDLIPENSLFFKYKDQFLNHHTIADLQKNLKGKLLSTFGLTIDPSTREVLGKNLVFFDDFFIDLLGKVNLELFGILDNLIKTNRGRLLPSSQERLDALAPSGSKELVDSEGWSIRQHLLCNLECYFLSINGAVNIINIEARSIKELTLTSTHDLVKDQHLPYLLDQLTPYYTSKRAFEVLGIERKDKHYSLSQYVKDFNDIMDSYLGRLLRTIILKHARPARVSYSSSNTSEANSSAGMLPTVPAYITGYSAIRAKASTSPLPKI